MWRDPLVIQLLWWYFQWHKVSNADCYNCCSPEFPPSSFFIVKKIGIDGAPWSFGETGVWKQNPTKTLVKDIIVEKGPWGQKMLSSFHCLIVCSWSPVLCLQSFGEKLDIKENDKGSPKRLSLLLFMWKVVFSAIGKVIFSSRGTQISHSGFHKPYREA